MKNIVCLINDIDIIIRFLVGKKRGVVLFNIMFKNRKSNKLKFLMWKNKYIWKKLGKC